MPPLKSQQPSGHRPYALSKLDNNGKPGERTQFPIYDSPKDFRRGIRKDLEGVSIEHCAMIERLQPFDGKNWLSTIQDLSNTDKHRTLVHVRGTGATFRGSAISRADADFIAVRGVKFPRTVQVDSRITGKVTFKDGAPIVETLQMLQAEVRAVIDKFEAFFDRD